MYKICLILLRVIFSVGTAAALSKILNGIDEEIFQKHVPNRLVYRTILEEYHKNPNKYVNMKEYIK